MEEIVKKFAMPIAILILAVMSFFIVKPIGVPIILGLVFAYIFHPLYNNIHKRIKSKNISALIIVILTFLIVFVPIVVLTPFFIKQLFEVFIVLKNTDLSALVFQLIPSLNSTPSISSEVLSALSHFNSSLSGLILTLFQDTIMSIPSILFGIVIVLFTFFFSLREGEYVKDYFSIIFPFSKEYKDIFFKKFDQVTNSVIYGHLILGVAAGIVAGFGYFIFGIPNVLLLTVITAIAGVLPVIGPWFIWIPLDIILFINGDTTKALQLLIYGLFVINWAETILRPKIVAEKADMNPAIALIGAVGGVYAFGIMGFIIGPLVLAYFILLIEIYKDKKAESIVIRKELAQEAKC